MAGRLIIRSTLRQLGRKRRTVAVTTTKQHVAYNNNMSALAINQQKLFSTTPANQTKMSDHLDNNNNMSALSNQQRLFSTAPSQRINDNNNNIILPKPTTIRLSERIVQLGLIKSIAEAEEMIKDMKFNSPHTERTISTSKRVFSENNSNKYIYVLTPM